MKFSWHQNQNSHLNLITFGVSSSSRNSWGWISAKMCSFCMLSLVATQHPAFFGIGKGLVVKKFMNDPIFIKQAEQFNQTDQTPECIVTAGEKAIVSLYGGSKTDGLDSLHYKCFCDKVSNSTMPVEPHSLPQLWQL